MKHQQAAGTARVSKEMMIKAIDDAICIVDLGGRDGVLPSQAVKDYVTARINEAQRDLDRVKAALIGGA